MQHIQLELFHWFDSTRHGMNPQPSVLVGIAQEIACAVFIAPMMLPQSFQHPEQDTQEFESKQIMPLLLPASNDTDGKGTFTLNLGAKKNKTCQLIDGHQIQEII